jgi:hypothetical protein
MSVSQKTTDGGAKHSDGIAINIAMNMICEIFISNAP